MHRRLLSRAFAAVMAALLLLTVVGPGEATHVCPVHDPLLARAVAASAQAHASNAMHGEHVHHDAAGHEGAKHCCCTGHVCTTPPIALRAAPVELVTAVVILPRATRLPEYLAIAAAHPYVLPFANGPPPARPA